MGQPPFSSTTIIACNAVTTGTGMRVKSDPTTIKLVMNACLFNFLCVSLSVSLCGSHSSICFWENPTLMYKSKVKVYCVPADMNCPGMPSPSKCCHDMIKGATSASVECVDLYVKFLDKCFEILVLLHSTLGHAAAGPRILLYSNFNLTKFVMLVSDLNSLQSHTRLTPTGKQHAHKCLPTLCCNCYQST